MDEQNLDQPEHGTQKPQGANSTLHQVNGAAALLPVAQRKLAALSDQGFRVCGVMIERSETDGSVTRGAVSEAGMVLWWHPEQSSRMPHTGATEAMGSELPKEAIQRLEQACLSYRHDFGLMTEDDQNSLMSQAARWMSAFGLDRVELDAADPRLAGWSFGHDPKTNEVLVAAPNCNPGSVWVRYGSASLEKRLLHSLGLAMATPPFPSLPGA